MPIYTLLYKISMFVLPCCNVLISIEKLILQELVGEREWGKNGFLFDLRFYIPIAPSIY